MGYQMNQEGFNHVLKQLSKEYLIYAPKCMKGGNTFSDVDCIRYGEVQYAEDIVFDKKSDYSFKEVLLPVSETLFYFTEGETKEADIPRKKGAIIFLRSCDLHAVKRLDDMYLQNGPADYYYNRLRENVKFVLMGCSQSYENCFCVDMGSNRSENYSLSVNKKNDMYYFDCKEEAWVELLKEYAQGELAVEPEYVTENQVHVNIPENLSIEVAKSKMWDEYDSRCIACGRCNFVCPTCTCFTMQDIFYSENGKVGERRRVQASCMVDGFTDVAGGGSYRKKNGERMRFKVLHKVYDYKKRNGYHMCVGCGRCDDVCPEYISFSNCINKLEGAMKEVLSK
ncbi:MAG: anaerobic sulfite reductase subunit AsrA [Candidatus Ruminococcus intestinipullorum]|nr:anaerobic sulfite reductase subunit AsrA [Candidatus Ruminococcus intestinipullorum]